MKSQLFNISCIKYYQFCHLFIDILCTIDTRINNISIFGFRIVFSSVCRLDVACIHIVFCGNYEVCINRHVFSLIGACFHWSSIRILYNPGEADYLLCVPIYLNALLSALCLSNLSLRTHSATVALHYYKCLPEWTGSWNGTRFPGKIYAEYVCRINVSLNT